MHKKKITVILLIILIGVIGIRIAGAKSLTFSLGLDSIYLRIVNIFEKDMSIPNEPLFNSNIEVSIPLNGWYEKPEKKETGNFFNLFKGNVNLTSKDYEVMPGGTNNSINPLSFVRFYNSSNDRELSAIGYGWRSFIDFRFILIDDIYVLRTPSGLDISFRFQPRENKYQTIKNGWLKYDLKFNENSGNFHVKTPDNKILEFTQSESENIFNLVSITHETGIVYDIIRNQKNKIESIQERDTDRKTRYLYNSANDLLKTVVFPSGEKLNFKYDKFLNLIEVDLSGIIKLTYKYNDAKNVHCITDVYKGDFNTLKLFYDNSRIRGVVFKGFKYDIISDTLFGAVKIKHENKSEFTFINAGEYQLKIKGPLSFEEKVVFDKLGRIAEINDAQKKQVVFSWDKNNRLIQKENHRKGVEVLNYDDEGNLASHIDSVGNKTELVYTDNLLSKIIYPDNTYEKFTYKGKLIESVIDYKGAKEKEFQYDESANLVRIISSENDFVEYKYNKDGLIEEKIIPGLWHEIYNWRGGRLLSVKFQEIGKGPEKFCSISYHNSGDIDNIRWNDNSKTTYNYDSFGNLKSKVFPAGSQVKYEYESENLYKKISRSDGRVLKIAYDLLMRPETIELGGSKQWKFIYDKKNNIPIMPFSQKFSKVIAPDGKKTEFFYDLGYGVEKIIWPGNYEDNYSYDLNGNMISVKNNYSSDDLSLFYDSNGFLEYLYDKAHESVLIFKHDIKGRLINFTDEKGKTFFINRNTRGKPVSLIEGVDKVVARWGYDHYGNISSIISNDKWREFYYNQSGNITGINDSAEGLTERKYHMNGLLLESADQEGRNIEYSHHANRLLKSKTYLSTDESFQWIYDLAGRPKRIKGDYSYKYEWNEDGSLAKLNFDKKNSLIYTYDLAGTIAKKTYPGYLNQENTYDDAGRILSISENGLDPVEYEYSDTGFLTKIIFPNNVVTEYDYDVNNKISSIISTDEDGEILFKRIYQYDEHDNIIKEETERGMILRRWNNNQIVWEKGDTKEAEEKTYSYENNRITGVKVKSSGEEKNLKYVYDSKTNNLIKIYSPEHLPREDNFRINLMGNVIDSGGFLEIDKQVVQVAADKSFVVNNVLLRPGANDIQVNAVTPSGRKESFAYELSYDPQALETRRIDSTGRVYFRSLRGTHMNYSYNDDGLLAEVNYLVGGKIRQIKYSYYGNKVLAERSDEIISSTQPSYMRYIFDENNNIIGELQKEGTYKSLYIYSPTGNIVYRIDRGQKKFYFHLDQFGSVIGITDQRGKAVAAYSYDSFGKAIYVNEKEKNNFRFLGHYQDVDSEFYFYKGKSLLPEEHAATFLSKKKSDYIVHPDMVINALLPEYYRKKINPFVPELFVNIIIPDEFKEQEFIPASDYKKIEDESFWVSRVKNDNMFENIDNQENKLFFNR